MGGDDGAPDAGHGVNEGRLGNALIDGSAEDDDDEEGDVDWLGDIRGEVPVIDNPPKHDSFAVRGHSSKGKAPSMFAELAFPGTIMLLKFVSKILIEQEVRAVDFFKALLSFPIDIAFLSLSFGSAVLLSILGKSPVEAVGKTILSFVLACLIFSLITIMFCRKSDRAFTNERNIATVVFAFLGYLLSALVLLGSVEMGAFL